VSFNYLGQLDATLDGLFAPSKLASGAAVGDERQRRHVIDVTAFVVGGQLHVTWTYSQAIHRQETIEVLDLAFGRALRDLIDHCLLPSSGGYTPSDFALTKLSQTALDELLERTGVVGRHGIEDIYPLSPMQQGMLFHTLFAPESGVYYEQLSCTVSGA